MDTQIELTPKFKVGDAVAVALHATFHGIVRDVYVFPDRVVYSVYITNRDAVRHNLLESELQDWTEFRHGG